MRCRASFCMGMHASHGLILTRPYLYGPEIIGQPCSGLTGPSRSTICDVMYLVTPNMRQPGSEV